MDPYLSISNPCPIQHPKSIRQKLRPRFKPREIPIPRSVDLRRLTVEDFKAPLVIRTHSYHTRKRCYSRIKERTPEQIVGFAVFGHTFSGSTRDPINGVKESILKTYVSNKANRRYSATQKTR